MLGRHVYRVTPLDREGWAIRKDGEAAPRGRRETAEAATELATSLALADQPSKIIVESAGGTIAEERSFGDDTAASLERVIDGKASVNPERDR